MLDATTIEEFKASLRGELIQPNDEGYDDARSLYNAMIDKRPRLITRCADVADVMTAVHFGRDNNLLFAIRGGGHNGPGLGSCDDGLVIDLSAMKGVRVDPENRTVRVGPGHTQGDMDHASHAFGLAVPAGIVSTTGIGGFTIDPDPSKAGALTTWAKEYWEAVHPYTMGGAYVNFMMEEGEERVKATCGDNYERLVEVKNKYDPANLFRVNQNIKPTAQKVA